MEQLETRNAEALAILAATVLQFSENGHIPDQYNSERAAVKWALRQAQYCHGWVVCGPIHDAMNVLLSNADNRT